MIPPEPGDDSARDIALDSPAEPTVDALPEPVPSSADPRWGRAFLVQLVIAVLSVTALHATRPMITYRALDLGAGPLEIGLVQSAFSILPVFTAVALGRFVDRVGEARFVAVAMAMMCLGAVVASLAGSLLVLAAAQTIMGFGQVTNLVAGQAMIANRGPRERREHRYGWYSTMASVGQLAGPAIGAALFGGGVAAAFAAADWLPAPVRDNDEAPVFLFAALATGIATLLALRLPHRAPRSAASGGPGERAPNLLAATWQVLRRPGMAAAMLVSIAAITAVDVLIAYLPAYGEATGLSVETVGLLLAVRAGAGLVSRVFMGWLIENVGRETVLAASIGMAGAGIVLLPVVSSVPVLLVLMVLIGLGVGLGQPMTIAWVANRSSRQERGLALGVRVTGNRAALLIVPTIMGAIAGASSISAIWLVMAAFLGASALVARRTPFDELAAARRPAARDSPA